MICYGLGHMVAAHYFYAYLQPELSEYDAWFNVKDEMLVLGVSVKDTSRIEHAAACSVSQLSKELRHTFKPPCSKRNSRPLAPFPVRNSPI